MAKKAKKKKPAAAKPKPKEKSDVTPHPTPGPKVQDFEDRLDDQIAGTDKDQRRRSPGRPAKDQAGEAEPIAISNEIIAGALKVPFELWAISQDVKGLSLSDAEAAQLAEPVKALLDYYCPMIPAIAYAWGSAAVSLFWITKTRLVLLQEIKKQRAKEERDGSPDVGRGAVVQPGTGEPTAPNIVGFPAQLKQQRL